MKFYIETERLILREILESDIEGMYKLDSNPEVHKYLGKKPIKTKLQAEEAISFIRQQYEERGIGRFAAIEKSSGDFMGWSGIKFNTGDKEVIGNKRDFYDIGYRFIPRYWGKGYATESSLATLDFGFKKLNIETMCGAAEIENMASNKVLQKIGLHYLEQFPCDGELVNWYELSLDQYKKLKLRRYNQKRYQEKKEKIQTYNRERYQKDELYKEKTLARSKNRYHTDEEYRKKTIENAKLRYKKNKNK